jgi:hypothetical protein
MTSDLPFLSFLGTFQFFTNSRDVMNKSVKQVSIPSKYIEHISLQIQWPGALYKVPDLFQWIVVATSLKHIEDLYKAPENVLSALEPIEEVSSISESCRVCVRLFTADKKTQSIQLDYTMGPNIAKDLYHIPIVRGQLTQSLPLLVPEVYDEVIMACNELIPIKEGSCRITRTCLKTNLTNVEQSGNVFLSRIQ